jgi:hypothetical protein
LIISILLSVFNGDKWTEVIYKVTKFVSQCVRKKSFEFGIGLREPKACTILSIQKIQIHFFDNSLINVRAPLRQRMISVVDRRGLGPHFRYYYMK